MLGALRIKRSLATIITALLLMCPALGALTEETRPDQGVLKATLENGLRVVVVRNALAPVVTTMMNCLVGSAEAPKGFPGMATVRST